MPTTPQGIWYPGSSDNVTPLETTFSTMASSIDNILGGDVQIHKVANTTARNALVSQFPPSASNPLVVWRADATNGRQLEYTKNGTTWHYVPTSEDDSGWQNITIASGWATQGSQTPQVRRVGSVVMMRGIIRPNPAGNIPTSSSTIATIPVGYRPGAWTYYSTVGSTVSTNIRMIVKDNGEIEISASNTSSTWVSLAVPSWIL